MPSYTQYMRQMATLDADDSEIESWITVKGNHIPIKKGQSKEDAVKSFIEGKGSKAKEESKEKHPKLQKGQVKLHRDIDDRYVIVDPDGAYTFYKDGVKGAQNRSLKGQEGALKELGVIGYKQNTYVIGGSEKEESAPSTQKKSDSPLVNAVANALGRSVEEAEKEIEGAAQYIHDLIKAKDLRNGDVEETLQGLGVEPDYAEEFMQWATYPRRKKK